MTPKYFRVSLPCTLGLSMVLLVAVLSAVLSSAAAQPPLPPSQLAFSDYQYASLNVSWVGPAVLPETVASYDLRWRPTGAAEWMAGSEFPSPVSAFVVTGLAASTHYEFALESRDSQGRTSKPLVAFGETISNYRATNVRAVLVKETEVNLAWEPARDGTLLGQQVFVSDDGGNSWKYNALAKQGPVLTPMAASHKINFLNPRTVYTFRVDSIFLGYTGISASVSSQSITTLSAPPQRVVGLRVYNLEPTSATLSWEALVGSGQIGSDSVVYFVDVAEAGDPSSTRDSYVVREVNRLQIGMLLRNVEYFFTVVAQNDQGKTSTPSERGSFTTPGALPAQMDAPAVTTTATGLLLSWKELVTNAANGGLPILSFKVFAKRQDEVGFNNGVDVGNVLSYQVPELVPNFFYEFAISGVSSLGTGPRGKSSTREMTPVLTGMQKPVLQVVDHANASVIQVSWTAPLLSGNVLNYRVFLRQVGLFTSMDNGTVVAASERTTSFSDLPDGTRFEIKVAAETAVGLSEISQGVYTETYSDTVPTFIQAASTVTGTTSCDIAVIWTRPRLQASGFRIFSTIEGIPDADTFLVSGTQTTFSLPNCARGAVYTFYVQAIFSGGSGGLISLGSPQVGVPVSAPPRMPGPTPALNPSNPSTSVLLTWVPPLIVNPAPKTVITSYILTVGHLQASNPADAVFNFTIPAPATAFTVTGLFKKTFYTFSIQAVNSLGPSEESPQTSITTDQTVPAPPLNLSVVPGSESANGDMLTLSWAVEDWGESDKAGPGTTYPYPYCAAAWPEQTPCPGRRYFLVTPFRVGDDYREPTFVYGNAFQYTFTGLSGGVDYKFVVVAVNTGGLQSERSEALRYRTVSVVPKAITTLDTFQPDDPDAGANWKVGLKWTIPLDAETTGGMALSGFTLRYAQLTACIDGCADTSGACIAQRNSISWTELPGVGGATDSYEYLGLKGATYVFSIAAINGVGRGVFWPSCNINDINCAGIRNGQIPYTCHSAVFTVPSRLENFGAWAEKTAGVQPSGKENFEIRWGVGVEGGFPEYFDYADKTRNGGRSIEMVEIQRTVRSKVRWPLDYYCPTLPAVEEGEQPLCLYQVGCIPEPCITSCPICVTAQFEETSFNAKKVQDFMIGVTPDLSESYVYRIRFSNINTNDCSMRPPSPGSSPMCDWSEWSDEQDIKIAKPQQFHNLFTKVNSPTEVQVLWFAPTETAEGGTVNQYGDIVDVWYGPTVASVTVSPFTLGNFTRGPPRGTTVNQWSVKRLVPATTYYFTVVAYFSSEDRVIEPTRSEVSKAIRTAVGLPAQVRNLTVDIPGDRKAVQAGGVVLSWIGLSSTCSQGTGLFFADGSVDNCQRGEGIALAAYKIYYRRSDGSAASWTYVLAPSSMTEYTLTGLEKEVKYKFKVSAVNSEKEGMASDEVEGAPIATIPGSPPPPLSTGASVSSVRVAWQEPADLGTKQVQETRFRLTIFPRRDGQEGNETITFTWEREYVVHGLFPNSLYLFSVAFQATPMLGFGLSSETAYVYTTPRPPSNLRLGDGNQVNGSFTTESTKVLIRWQWSGVLQGNVTISGYRLTYSSRDGTSKGETFCSGGSAPVDGIPGGVSECVLAGLQNGKLYSILMAASNDPRLETNFGPESTPMLLQTKSALPTVVNIGFTDTSSYGTKISWTTYDGGLPIQGYSLQMKRENDAFDTGQIMVSVDTTPGDGGWKSSYLVTGLGANLYYRFIVVATNSLGFRPSEPSISIRTQPAAVSAPTVDSVSSNHAIVSWPVWYGKNKVTDYSIQMRKNQGPGDVGEWVQSGTVTGQQFQVSSLLANTGYDIRIAGVNVAGTGNYGESVYIKTQAQAPDFVYVTRVGPGDCELRWFPKPGATPQYTVFPTRWSQASSSWIEETGQSKADGTIDSFHVTGLVKGARYYFQVASSSLLGVGARSTNSHEVTTASSIPEPGPRPAVSDPSVAGIMVTWQAVTMNEFNGGSPTTAYVLYKYAVAQGSAGWQVATTLNPDVFGAIPTAYVANGLQPGVYYQFRVAVVNSNGQGPPGPASEMMPTVPGKLPAPFQQAFLKTILLTWTPPVNNSFTAYRVYFSAFTDNLNDEILNEEQLWEPWTFQIVPGSTTLMKFDNLKPDFAYRFKVAARNPSGWGEDSDVVISRTTIVSDPWSMDTNNQIALQISTPTITTTSAQLTWLGPASFDDTMRGSAVGFRIIACQVESLICDVGEDYLNYCQLDPPNIYTRSHECDITKISYVRSGLMKNTLYTFQLAVVNPGGEGPRSKSSPEFRTKASYPDQMSRPVARTLSKDSISVQWDRMVDWNQRGGLDITGYVLFKQVSGGAYDAGEVVYEGTSFVYTDLPSNTKFYFATVAENTWCTLCRTDIIVPEGKCYFEPCCDVHSCSPKSSNSIAVSTIPGKMTLPRLKLATIYDIVVTWDEVPGTPDNIFEYSLRFRDIDRADKDDSGGWVQRTFLGTQNGIGVKEYALVNLDPNNRYEVILNADNGFGYGDPSDPAILMTLANKVESVEIVAARSTEVTLQWKAPPGRTKNFRGYQIVYRLATQAEIMLQHQAETLPLSNLTSDGPATLFDVTNLLPNSSYIFAVAAINDGGVGEFSEYTQPSRTMSLDLLGSCFFYSVSDRGRDVQGSLIVQQKATGTATLRGTMAGLRTNVDYFLMSQQYGKSSTASLGSIQSVVNFTASLDGQFVMSSLETSLVLTGLNSAITSSLVLFDASNDTPLCQCEIGMAKPRSGADENAALPAPASRTFCRLVPLSSGIRLSGGFIASPTHLGIRIRGRVCGISNISSQFTVRLHEYGDIQTGNFDDIGESVYDLGTMYLDALKSANFDLMDATDIGFKKAPGVINIMGRSIVLYNQEYLSDSDPDPATTAIAACVLGAAEPSIDTTVYQVEALYPACTPCTWLMGLQESMFTVAELFKTDWISVWSLNKVSNPDRKTAGTSIYYAHPYVMQSGETMTSLRHRFGITTEHIGLLNNKKTEFVVGETICIVPMWQTMIDKNGGYICTANYSASLQ